MLPVLLLTKIFSLVAQMGKAKKVKALFSQDDLLNSFTIATLPLAAPEFALGQIIYSILSHF